MDNQSRLAYIKQHIDALAFNVDETHGSCDDTLAAAGVLIADARAKLNECRDAVIAKRRADAAAKEAAAAKRKAA